MLTVLQVVHIVAVLGFLVISIKRHYPWQTKAFVGYLVVALGYYTHMQYTIMHVVELVKRWA